MTVVRQYSLERRLSEAWPTSAWQNTHVVIAVSGGPDSVAMLRATVAIKQRCGADGKVFAAHFNHALRGDAADGDQVWLEGLCDQLEVPLEIGRAGDAAIAAPGGGTSEAASRAARYQFLRETAEKLGARFVAVAHTVDDQVETILHRVVRGTGLDGLAGMPVSRPLSPSVALIRPLLAVPRAAILEYLQEIGQSFRVDESNVDPHWTRNRLRHELLPFVRERFNSGVDDALLRLATQAGEAQHLVAGIAAELARVSVRTQPATPVNTSVPASTVLIDCRRLDAASPLVIRELCKSAWQQAGWPLQAMGFAEWQQLAEMIQGVRKLPTNLPGNVWARRDGHTLGLESRG